ncbi:SDR family oxidoreductase [Apilactobacillus sp. M161]|uniref:SDR family oxidoreductase n=1 Tax=Apilactobacillus xinyiensis TaxID=2841032 RepID=A0ABT0I1N6_9LACO|nr:SDR family oxidoreductase [Apilactobacillus xinyiensis]
MKKILVLGKNNLIAQKLIQILIKNNFDVITMNEQNLSDKNSYSNYLSDVDVIYSFLGPMDVDLCFEALFESINEGNINLRKFIMCSTAGVDKELDKPIKYPNVKDVKEYLNEQRYAIKIVDEYEIPYTILRPVELVDTAFGKVFLYKEGETMPAGKVSTDIVSKIAYDVLQNGQYENTSIGIVEK